MDQNNPATWGQLAFGLRSYRPLAALPDETWTIRQGLSGATVVDGSVGGYTICGEGTGFWDGWGDTNYAGQDRFNIQNQLDIADWSCFSKYYVTFPLPTPPAGKVLISANMTLYENGSAGQGGTPRPVPSYIQVLTVGEDWQEETLTWNNAPLAAENVAASWVTPVDDWPQPWPPGFPQMPYNWDVSWAVMDALGKGQPLRLAVYSADQAYNSGRYFNSSDMGDWNAVGRPTLTVVWGLVEGDHLTEWPQVQRDAQRTGYYPGTLGTNFRVAWTRAFQPDRVFPQVQAIISGGKVFVGTESGRMYALDAKTGQEQWVFSAGGPILNSAAAAGGRVFFGAMDGAVYAVDAATGQLAWKFTSPADLGFSTAPLIAEGKLLLGGRDGSFYALSPDTGSLLWRHDVGSPILQTAAWNNGRIFFGAMDMRVYALNASDGSLAWQSEEIPGVAFKDYWPVVHAGQVIVRPMAPGEIMVPALAASPYVLTYNVNHPGWQWLLQNGPTIAAGHFAELQDAMALQDTAMAMYQANPTAFRKSLHILNETTGHEDFAVPHWDYQVQSGAVTPPCVDREGKLIVPVPIMYSGWGRLDLNQRRVVDLLYDHTRWGGAPFTTPGDRPSGWGARDEAVNVTCAANFILSLHGREYGSNYSGAFNMDTRKWYQIGVGYRNGQMHVEGGGGNPASIAGDMVYHITSHELVARSTR